MGALHYSLLHLTGLSDSDSWSLFESQAFVSGRSEEHPNLVAIGKDIVKKCGGVPLAAKALGSLLRLKREEEASWLSVRDSQIWEQKEDEIVPALRLSYTNLPSHLRQCFSFCSVFPKGFTIEKEELLLFWMANGFVTPNGRMELEDIGNEIFNNLLWRSFFQDIEKDDDGNITRCKTHDLVHDLAQSIIGNKCYIVDREKTKNIPPLTRYIYSHLLSSPLNDQRLYKAKTIKTILLRHCYNFQVPSNIKELRYLRCLDLREWERKEIPDSICNLKQLRYINLSNSNSIETIPESISYLPNLQTLKLRHCYKLRNLPKDMRKMSSLRHVDTYGCR
ncbi:putative disease resistance protein RGA1 [Tasmannia lanceolata]|uniref:putative disease resistance protein RGA1 n=1 Tax=Tasmannia lanceolata TaxID=3420 RepID=UPI004063425E